MAPDVVAAHGPAAPARPPAWRSFVSAQEPILFGLLGLLAVGALWEIAARLDWVRPILISSPSQIFDVGVREFSSGRIWADLWVSFVEYAVGLLAALVIGVVIGI